MRGPRFYAVPHEEPPHLLTVIEDAVGLPKPALWFRTEERAVKFAESVNVKLSIDAHFGPEGHRV